MTLDPFSQLVAGWCLGTGDLMQHHVYHCHAPASVLSSRSAASATRALKAAVHAPRCAISGQAHILPPGIPEEPDGGSRLCPPRCQHCSGSVRPGVVWFGGNLPEKVLDHSFAAANACDVLFVIGTSGLVQPAARIPSLARQAGAKVVQVNPMGTQLDDACTWSLRGAAGVVMSNLLQAAFPCAGSAES